MQQEEKRIKILAVDDNPKNIQVIGSILRSANYQVGFAFNGNQAIDLLSRSVDYDLVLLDVNMPGLSGYETCLKIREIESAKEIPVIFLTAMDDVENVVKGFEAGAQDYVTKPFKSAELLKRIQTHIELRSSKQKLANANLFLEEQVQERTMELEMANKELKLLDFAKNDFLQIISHEINTPLNGIIGFTNILKEELKNDELFEMIHFLDLSAKRLEKFVKKSLLMAELQTQKKKIYYADVDISTLIQEQLAISKDSIELKNIVFKTQIEVPSVFADPELLKMTLKTMIEYPVHYSRKGGTIELTTFVLKQYVVIQTIDLNAHLPDLVAKNPFHLFGQDENYLDDYKGIDLTLTKLIMQAHKGDAELINLPEGGVQFTISLPMPGNVLRIS